MRDIMDIGSAPSDEECAQVGDDDYHTQSIKECRAYINLLRRVLGEEPVGARLKIQSYPHDFGSYFEVVCIFDETYPDSVSYAFKCEGHSPAKWDDRALKELGRKRRGWTS